MACAHISLTPQGERRCNRAGHHEIGGLLLCWQHEQAVRSHYEAPLLGQIENLRRELESLRPFEYVDTVIDDEGDYHFDLTLRSEQDSFVYFARLLHVTASHPHYGLIKIGRTVDLERRMGSLGTEAILAIPGGPQRESDLHRQFAHLRVDGEWFRPASDLLAEMARL